MVSDFAECICTCLATGRPLSVTMRPEAIAEVAWLIETQNDGKIRIDNYGVDHLKTIVGANGWSGDDNRIVTVTLLEGCNPVQLIQWMLRAVKAASVAEPAHAQ